MLGSAGPRRTTLFSLGRKKMKMGVGVGEWQWENEQEGWVNSSVFRGGESVFWYI